MVSIRNVHNHDDVDDDDDNNDDDDDDDDGRTDRAHPPG